MSIHIKTEKSDISNKVILPGDPLRAKRIAETFFENPKEINQVRNMLGYSGDYNNEFVSVQGTGMGMPSISIYVEELIRNYGVNTLVRTGTCGAISEDLELGDIVLATAASTDSNMNRVRFPEGDFAPVASFDLLMKAFNAAIAMNKNVKVGGVLSSDYFYHPNPDSWKNWAKYGIKVIEMETSALYTISNRENVESLSILTVTDIIPKDKHVTPEERESGFRDMARIALNAITSNE